MGDPGTVACPGGIEKVLDGFVQSILIALQNSADRQGNAID
ncbi:MAG: hypothetical protein ACU843_00945 [Gammaproteobacteria bacterium]